MNQELFFKRLKLLRTFAVASREEESFKRASLDKICTLLSCDDLQSLDRSQHPQLLLVFASEDPVQSKECMKSLRKIGHWKLLLFCDDPKDPSMMELALEMHAFSIHKKPGNEKDFIAAVAPVLPSLIERLQESSRAAQMHKIVEMGPAKLLLGGLGQVTYMNPRAKELLKIENIKDEFKKVEEVLKPLIDSEKSSLQKRVEYGEKTLMVRKDEESFGKEKLFTFLELDLDEEEGLSHVTRLEFVDRLKDKMAQRIESTLPLSLLMVHMKNFEHIANSFDWVTVHAVQKELNDLLLEIFDNFESYGLWQPDMALVLFENVPTQELKKKISLFISRMRMQEFSKGIVPAVDFTLIDIKSDDLNAMINLIEKEYSGSISVSDTQEFGIYTASSRQESMEEPDIVRQFLTNIMADRLPLKLTNIYKGIPISTPTKILKMEDEKIIVTAEKIQKFVMESEKEVVLQSVHLPSDIHAQVHFIDPSRPLVILKHLKTMKSSINNRKHTRVTVTSRLPITLKVGKSHYTGYVHDISINSIAILFNIDKFDENELKEKSAEVSFKLPWNNDDGFVNLTVDAKILFNKNEREFHKVVVILEPDDLSESYIFDYIYKRQKELIKELKARL